MAGGGGKAAACRAVDAAAGDLVALSDWMFAHPELGLREVQAAERLTALLERAGAGVERGIAGLPTAFRATIAGRRTRPTVAIIAEYDALPEVGHGCGHNIIATAAIGAGIGLADLGEALPGTVVVLGCPAEESAVPGAGGKIYLLDAGYFDDVDAAIMVHPMTENRIGTASSLVAYGLDFEFFGRAAHAAAAPHEGVNALDAVIQTFNGVGALRQQVKPDVRIHGVITHGGGAPNVIPPYAAARFRVRAADPADAEDVVGRVVRCAEAGALATGARLEWKHYIRPYLNMLPNRAIGGAFARNLRALGLHVADDEEAGGSGSTDFGNVSHRVPAVEAYLRICGPEAGWHSRAVAEATVTAAGHDAIVAGAKGLAMTALDLLGDGRLLEAARREHAAVATTSGAAGLVRGD
ncbi:MAG TPA: M20 family metallopeptidase [Thermomicrobiaceae bacterium]|nr:M20 family metallopeptidase [Thermomicrobiaceae bacterium]